MLMLVPEVYEKHLIESPEYTQLISRFQENPELARRYLEYCRQKFAGIFTANYLYVAMSNGFYEKPR